MLLQECGVLSFRIEGVFFRGYSKETDSKQNRISQRRG